MTINRNEGKVQGKITLTITEVTPFQYEDLLSFLDSSQYDWLVKGKYTESVETYFDNKEYFDAAWGNTK